MFLLKQDSGLGIVFPSRSVNTKLLKEKGTGFKVEISLTGRKANSAGGAEKDADGASVVLGLRREMNVRGRDCFQRNHLQLLKKEDGLK